MRQTIPDGLLLTIALLLLTVIVLLVQDLHIMDAFSEVAHRIQRTVEGVPK